MEQLKLFNEEVKTMNEQSFEFYVAGVQHHNLGDVEDYIDEGISLQLVPEPDNQYDPNAIKVMFGPAATATMLGYVPQKKELSAKVKAMLEVHDSVSCVVTEFKPEARPWEKLFVKITAE